MPSNEPTNPLPDFQPRLAKAIAQGAILASFQPIVDAQTHHVVGCEAVPCWHDEIYGHVQGRTFMPVAQRLGMMEELGLQVWSHALACLHAWHEQGFGLTLLGNVSRQEFRVQDFTIRMATDLRRLGMPLSCVDLEIAENVVMEDGPTAIARLTALREAGFGVVIGEFGSGYSPFSQGFGKPSTGVRIDSALTRQVHQPEGAELIEAIVKVARSSNLQTTAASVENAETAAMLTLLGVQRLQGSYIGAPVERQAFERLLAQDHHAP
jgi:EAL domain-containing protein (putative c-di-GMP-specific phosphodiesterase class I)